MGRARPARESRIEAIEVNTRHQTPPQLAGRRRPFAHDVVRAVRQPDPHQRHDEVTGIPTAGDVTLLGMLLEAERSRVSPDEAEQQLASDADYSSPFIAMPF